MVLNPSNSSNLEWLALEALKCVTNKQSNTLHKLEWYCSLVYCQSDGPL